MRLAADENFQFQIVRGLRRWSPWLDVVRVQDAGLTGADDPGGSDLAAREGEVLLTHDIATISPPAYEKSGGAAHAGVFKIHPSLPIAQVIEDLLLLIEASEEGEWEGKILDPLYRAVRPDLTSPAPAARPATSPGNVDRPGTGLLDVQLAEHRAVVARLKPKPS